MTTQNMIEKMREYINEYHEIIEFSEKNVCPVCQKSFITIRQRVKESGIYYSARHGKNEECHLAAMENKYVRPRFENQYYLTLKGKIPEEYIEDLISELIAMGIVESERNSMFKERFKELLRIALSKLEW